MSVERSLVCGERELRVPPHLLTSSLMSQQSVYPDVGQSVGESVGARVGGGVGETVGGEVVGGEVVGAAVGPKMAAMRRATRAPIGLERGIG